MARLSPLDVSFLYLEEPTTPMHVGAVATFAPPQPDPDGPPWDYDRLLALLETRIALVPRYRQKVRPVPGRLANPVWVDDPAFDITYHLRRSALPRPGTDAQLRELVARVMSRPLDRRRPLWEMYLVEGLTDGRAAIITKTHHAMVDGVRAVDLASVLLDASPTPREVPAQQWVPVPEPSAAELVADAAADLIRRPTAALDALRSSLLDLRTTTAKAAAAAVGLASALRVAARPAPTSPLNVQIGEQRRFATLATDLDDYRRVRKHHGGTVNDVVLATVAGALRTWLLTRGEPVSTRTTLRALVPVSVRGTAPTGQHSEPEPDAAPALGNRISAYLVDLPVGETSPVIRLAQISYAMQAHKDAGASVGAEALVALSGFAPPTLHALGARVANSGTRRIFNLVVTNVPGPQLPLFAAGAQMLEVFPVAPLAKGQALSVGLNSYNGGLFYGLNADRDAMPDVDVLSDLLEESLAELVQTVP